MVMFLYARYSQAGRKTTDNLSCFLFGVLRPARLFDDPTLVLFLLHSYH